jgi:hypothetical protein
MIYDLPTDMFALCVDFRVFLLCDFLVFMLSALPAIRYDCFGLYSTAIISFGLLADEVDDGRVRLQ